MSIPIRSTMRNTRSSPPWWRSGGRSDVARSAALRRVGASRTAAAPLRNARAHNETLTEQAYRVIDEQIVTLRLKPGEVLSEQSLSATSRIGRTPVREALQRLA